MNPLEMRCENRAWSSLLDLCSLAVNLYEAPARSKHKVTDIRMPCVTSAVSAAGAAQGRSDLGKKKRGGWKKVKKVSPSRGAHERAGSPQSR